MKSWRDSFQAIEKKVESKELVDLGGRPKLNIFDSSFHTLPILHICGDKHPVANTVLEQVDSTHFSVWQGKTNSSTKLRLLDLDFIRILPGKKPRQTFVAVNDEKLQDYLFSRLIKRFNDTKYNYDSTVELFSEGVRAVDVPKTNKKPISQEQVKLKKSQARLHKFQLELKAKGVLYDTKLGYEWDKSSDNYDRKEKNQHDRLLLDYIQTKRNVRQIEWLKRQMQKRIEVIDGYLDQINSFTKDERYFLVSQLKTYCLDSYYTYLPFESYRKLLPKGHAYNDEIRKTIPTFNQIVDNFLQDIAIFGDKFVWILRDYPDLAYNEKNVSTAKIVKLIKEYYYTLSTITRIKPLYNYPGEEI